MDDETKSHIVTELLYQKSSVSQLWKNRSKKRKAMLLKILKVQDKAAWMLRHTMKVRAEEVTDVIAYFLGLRDVMKEGKYVPKIEDDDDDWGAAAEMVKGPFDEEKWFHQCMDPKKKESARSFTKNTKGCMTSITERR